MARREVHPAGMKELVLASGLVGAAIWVVYSVGDLCLACERWLTG